MQPDLLPAVVLDPPADVCDQGPCRSPAARLFLDPHVGQQTADTSPCRAGQAQLESTADAPQQLACILGDDEMVGVATEQILQTRPNLGREVGVLAGRDADAVAVDQTHPKRDQSVDVVGASGSDDHALRLVTCRPGDGPLAGGPRRSTVAHTETSPLPGALRPNHSAQIGQDDRPHRHRSTRYDPLEQ